MKEPPRSQNVLRAMGSFVALIRKTARPSLVPPYAARALRKLFFAWRINIATACEMDRNRKDNMGKRGFSPFLNWGKNSRIKEKMKKTGEELPSFTTPQRAPVRSELSPNIYRHALIVHGAERTVERERERASREFGK